MKKNSLHLMKFVVGLTILLGVLLILLANEKSFKKIATNDIENITRLSSSIIYAEIDNSLTKPIFVGQTMANDLFLKNWMHAEAARGASEAQKDEIQRYLAGYREKYGYDSVFLVSAKSSVYYYYEGINKVVAPQNAHDVWYYQFLESGAPYALDVDLDEANHNELTVFVNCRVEDENGALLGVVGVGVRMAHLQELLAKYENEYDLKAFLINDEGLTQIDAVAENIETANFFDTPETAALRDKVLNNKTEMQTFWYPQNALNHCIITKYVANLGWYIVVEKNTAAAQQVLTDQIHRDLVPIAGIIVVVLLMISCIIGKYNRMLLQTASVDDVTNLPNAKMFQEIFGRNTKRPACREGTVFMFDIDNFKDINDRFGHLLGNTALYRISEQVRATVGSAGVVSRWGGDEFAGVIYGSHEAATELLRKMSEDITQLHEGELCGVTISVGATAISAGLDLDALLRQADIAMYRAKENGKNQVIFFSE